jgi:hypothetical protein
MIWRRARQRTMDLHECLSALENRIENYETGLLVALTAKEAVIEKEELQQIRRQAAQDLNRERASRAELLAEVEG